MLPRVPLNCIAKNDLELLMVLSLFPAGVTGVCCCETKDLIKP